MTIENLLKVVTPPAEPDEPFSGPWEPVEAELRVRLPQDYKDFVRLFGCGKLLDFIGINVPRCRNPYVRLEAEMRGVYEMFGNEDYVEYALWPNRGGLITFGQTDVADYLVWNPIGPPENWKVGVLCIDLGTFEEFDCGLTDFLSGIVAGSIRPKDFPDELLPAEYLFRPYSSWPKRDESALD